MSNLGLPEEYEGMIEQFVKANHDHHQDEIERADLAAMLAEVARIASGDLPSDGQAFSTLMAELERRLFTIPGLALVCDIPIEFWDTEIGQMIALARVKAYGDELISIAEAAELRGVTVQALSQMVSRGRLQAYHDPQAPSRQGRRLVSRRQVEELD